MSESIRLQQAARRAIARAKARHDEKVTPDDLLVGALTEVSRFGIAWIGDWAVDVTALSDCDPGERYDSGPAAEPSDEEAPTPAYDEASVRLFERAASLAGEDGASTTGMVHILAAFAHRDCGLMQELRDEYGFSEAEWRSTLALGPVGVLPRLAGSGGDGTNGRPSTEPEMLGVEEAAEYLGVHSQTVRNYIRSGKLPAYRLAGERFIRVLRRDLLTLLERVPTDDSEKPEET